MDVEPLLLPVVRSGGGMFGGLLLVVGETCLSVRLLGVLLDQDQLPLRSSSLDGGSSDKWSKSFLPSSFATLGVPGLWLGIMKFFKEVLPLRGVAQLPNQHFRRCWPRTNHIEL